MSTPFKPRENPTTNMINLEDVAETSRLIEIDHLYTKAMGSLFPPVGQKPTKRYIQLL